MTAETAREGSLTAYVAEFAASTRFAGIPGDVVDLGKKSILDGLGLALAGSVAKSGGMVRRHLQGLGSTAVQAATVIGTNLRVPARFAAFANGIGVHADDYDDTQLAVAKDRVYGLLTHPTAPALPAVLAVAETRTADRDGSPARPTRSASRSSARSPRRSIRATTSTGSTPPPPAGRSPRRPGVANLLGLSADQTRDGAGHRRQPVGRAARELRHHDEALPRRAARRRAAFSPRSLPRLGLTATPIHPRGRARLLPRRRRRLRRRGDPRQARHALDVRVSRRLHQAASVRLADPSRA